MSMKNVVLFPSRTFSHIKILYNLRTFARNYASDGVMYWDRPINTKIKLEIETFWRDKVAALNGNRASNEADKFYVLSMFPYPSGSLHMGHVRVYTMSDTIARYYRMNGKYVIHPIGWDAFGLPAENAAIERNIDPEEWTLKNITQMREQLKALGCSFDWDREIATCDPKYYKWTQELFLKLYERKLVYKKCDYVNWDPVDQTVLANEQVSANGTSWRSGAKVEKKLLNQWFIKTTAFAESLLKGLDDPILKEWRDIIKIQKNWIGQCNGSNFRFDLVSENPDHPKCMNLWTEFPEYIKDVKFVAVSRKSILHDQKFSDDEKVSTSRLVDISFVNPFTKESLPVFLTDEVEFHPGTDTYLGIPSFSERDAELCRTQGIKFEAPDVMTEEERLKKRQQILLEARERELGDGYMVSSHLQDWLISRQRFWGTPIPIINCKKCGDQSVPRKQLPVTLPKLGQSSKEKKLISMDEWKSVKCPSCGGPATREADTMDTFVDSSWYFMRYLDPNYEEDMVSKEKADKLLPVDLYIGGKEHALLHLYFARFVNHFLHSVGLVPTREPFKQLLVLAFVMGKTFRVQQTGKYLPETEVEKVDGKLVERSTGLAVNSYWDKMSKSKYNGVDPVEMFQKYSLDTIRLLIMSDAAPTSQRNWSTDSFDIITNWENKLWLLIRQFLKLRKQFVNGELQIEDKDVEKDDTDMFQQRNYHLSGVCYNIVGSQQLSVAISKMQSLTKRLRKVSPSGMVKCREFERALAVQLIMLAPLAPHFASELWAGFCSAPGRIVNDGEIRWDKEVLEQNWPQIDMDFKLKLNVFVNNHLVNHIPVQRKVLINSSLDDILTIAENDSKTKKYLENYKIVNASTYSLCNVDLDLNLKTVRMSEKVSQETSN